jgi:hypothetical protein
MDSVISVVKNVQAFADEYTKSGENESFSLKILAALRLGVKVLVLPRNFEKIRFFPEIL